MRVVDPANPMPKYLQISTWLKEMIHSGRYRKGDKLPSEVKLSKLCAVNRNTLRQAVGELVSEGILRKEKGTGTYVASSAPPALTHKLKRVSSFSDDLREMGLEEKTILVHKGIEEASEHVAKTLLLGSDRRVVSVKRLRTGDDLPLIFEESYLPAGLFQDILDKDLTGSMYRMISEEFQVVLARSDQIIRAVNLKGKIAAYFGLPENAAGLFMESVTYDESTIPVELLCAYYRGDRYAFEVEVGRYLIQGAGAKFSLDK